MEILLGFSVMKAFGSIGLEPDEAAWANFATKGVGVRD